MKPLISGRQVSCNHFPGCRQFRGNPDLLHPLAHAKDSKGHHDAACLEDCRMVAIKWPDGDSLIAYCRCEKITPTSDCRLPDLICAERPKNLASFVSGCCRVVAGAQEAAGGLSLFTSASICNIIVAVRDFPQQRSLSL